MLGVILSAYKCAKGKFLRWMVTATSLQHFAAKMTSPLGSSNRGTAWLRVRHGTTPHVPDTHRRVSPTHGYSYCRWRGRSCGHDWRRRVSQPPGDLVHGRIGRGK